MQQDERPPRKMSLKRAESQASNRSKTPSVKWKDPVLSPTFHDVQIEQVQIVGPSRGGTVTFNEASSDKQSAEGRSSTGLKMVAPPPSEEGSLATNNSDERHAFRENYLYSANESRRVQNRSSRSPENLEQRIVITAQTQERASTVPHVTLPMEPGAVLPRVAHTRQQSRPSAAEQVHRQKLAIIRHMQRLQTTESPQQRRLMSATKKNAQKQRYYEVAPGILLTEHPTNEFPQTAPESGFGYYETDVNAFYEDRAHVTRDCPAISGGLYRGLHSNTGVKNYEQEEVQFRSRVYFEEERTVPHITKSIIWTAKNRVASGRALSSNSSSKWRAEFTDMDSHKKANIFIKMPFKQTPYVTMNQEKPDLTDDIVHPGYELRLTTAFTVSRVKKAFKRMDPPDHSDPKAGRLLKARLKPLYPVKVQGPNINRCQGIQPENKARKKTEGYTPSPSRQRNLKEQLNKAYEEQRSKRAEYERRMIRAQSATSGESVHRTSPQPEALQDLPDQGFVLNQQTGLDANFPADNMMAVSSQLDPMQLESGVIF